MPSPFILVSSLYLWFSRHRGLLFASALTVVLVSILTFAFLEMHQDIQSMLPEAPSEVADHFKRLQQAPFARKVMINLTRGRGTEKEVLLQSARRLAESMEAPYFTQAISGPPEAPGRALFRGLVQGLPNLITDRDVKALSSSLTEPAIRSRLKALRAQLMTPGGWAAKEMIRRDPLELRLWGLKKLRFIHTIPKMRLENNRFISADGNSALVIAGTDIEITDSGGAKTLVEHVNNLVKKVVPPQIKVSLVSGHRYTLANAEIIKRDLFLVLAVSALAIGVIFLIYLKTWSAVFVFLVPASVFCLAALGVSCFRDRVSAITLGFGSVLLGISVDFALHVYFALRRGKGPPPQALAEVSRPLLFGGLTSLAAFSVLLFSRLPGQRELAIFAITGLAAALVLSLVLLPHLVRPGAEPSGSVTKGIPQKGPRTHRWIAGVWAILLLVCAWQGLSLQFDGDLRSLSIVPPELRAAEDQMRRTWGGLRDRAIIFSEASDLQSALRINEAVFARITGTLSESPITSLAPLLPSFATQQANQRRWFELWNGTKGAEIQEYFKNESDQLGFSPLAFTPFFHLLNTPPPFLQPEDLRKMGLSSLVDSLLSRRGQKVQVLTLAPDTLETAGLLIEGPSPVQGIQLISQSRFRKTMSRVIAQDFSRFVLRASLLVMVLLLILYRNFKKVLYALVPAGTGLAFMFGIMGWLGLPCNLFNIVASILIVGLGADYGIFMVCKLSEGYKHATERAVLVSGLTTLAGFGALVLARHPALHSIGLTVLLGIGPAIPAALLVVPALYRLGERR
jgi:predicted exporter